MTIQEIARNEGITERSAQRYVTVGYKGHLLPATRSRRAYVITLDDYRAWRVACGFNEPETRPAEPAQPQVSDYVEPEESVESPAPSSPTYPPWPMAADPNGELTNGPAEHSRNWPHPKSCEAHSAEQLRKQHERLRGIPDEE